MRWLIGLVVAAFVLWGGYWFVGSTAMRRAAENWFANAPAQGLVAENTGLAVRGFPNRFDLTVDDIRIGDPARGVEWQAPFAQVFVLSYKPWHMIFALPNEQALTLPAGRFDIRSEKMTGSLVVVPGGDLALNRLRAEGISVQVGLPGGQVLQAAKIDLATERDAARENAHRIGLQINDLLLPAGVAARTGLPAQVGGVHLDATVQFDAPVDRHWHQRQPHVVAVSLRDAQVIWGEVTLTASGDLVADADGFADGKLSMQVRNWRAALGAAQSAGVIQPNLARNIERALQLMALRGGDPDNLDIPLTFAQGQARLGVIPLGPAPLLDQRQ